MAKGSKADKETKEEKTSSDVAEQQKKAKTKGKKDKTAETTKLGSVTIKEGGGEKESKKEDDEEMSTSDDDEKDDKDAAESGDEEENESEDESESDDDDDDDSDSSDSDSDDDSTESGDGDEKTGRHASRRVNAKKIIRLSQKSTDPIISLAGISRISKHVLAEDDMPRCARVGKDKKGNKIIKENMPLRCGKNMKHLLRLLVDKRANAYFKPAVGLLITVNRKTPKKKLTKDYSQYLYSLATGNPKDVLKDDEGWDGDETEEEKKAIRAKRAEKIKAQEEKKKEKKEQAKKEARKQKRAEEKAKEKKKKEKKEKGKKSKKDKKEKGKKSKK